MTKISKKMPSFCSIGFHSHFIILQMLIFHFHASGETLIHTLWRIPASNLTKRDARVMHRWFFLRRHGSTAGFGVRLHRLLDEDSKLKSPKNYQNFWHKLIDVLLNTLDRATCFALST